MEFELCGADLRLKPHYEALSYEWRDRVGLVPVPCSGRYMLVTPNLKSALTKIRLKDEVRTLWVDAVCINQEDVPERSQQVATMGSIFGDASPVIMWLGEEFLHTESGFVALGLFAKVYDLLDGTDMWHPGLEAVTLQPGTSEYQVVSSILHELLDDCAAHSHGLEDFFQRTPLTRAWILQEIVLAKEATLVCGSVQSDWDTARKALWVIYFRSFSLGAP